MKVKRFLGLLLKNKILVGDALRFAFRRVLDYASTIREYIDVLAVSSDSLLDSTD